MATKSTFGTKITEEKINQRVSRPTSNIASKHAAPLTKPTITANPIRKTATTTTTKTTTAASVKTQTTTTATTKENNTTNNNIAKTSSFSMPVQMFDSRTVVSNSSISTFSFSQPIVKQNSNTNVVPTTTAGGGVVVKPSSSTMNDDHQSCLSDEETEDEMSIEPSLENIDIGDEDDAQFVSFLVGDIFEFLCQKEVEVRIPHNYFASLSSILPKHRDVMANWICESSIRLKLLSETTFLAVNILDRILSSVRVSRKKLALVSVAALLIASKFEETYAPTLSDLQIITEKMFDDTQILDMERILLTKIDFNLCIPIPLHFLRRFSKAARSDSLTHTLAKYITELSILHNEMISFLPSEVAAAAVYIARRMKNISPLWNSNLRHYTHYTEDQILPCVRTLNEIVIAHSKRQTKHPIFSKYAERRLLSVSLIPCVQI